MIDMAATAGMAPTVKVSLPKSTHRTEVKSAVTVTKHTVNTPTHRVSAAKRPTRKMTTAPAF